MTSLNDTWYDIQNACISKGGKLATLISRSEIAFVKSTFSSIAGSLWIGYSDINGDGSWEWIDDSASTFTNWKSGEPQDYNIYYSSQFNCAVIDTSTGKWSNDYCYNYYYGLCKYDTHPGV